MLGCFWFSILPIDRLVCKITRWLSFCISATFFFLSFSISLSRSGCMSCFVFLWFLSGPMQIYFCIRTAARLYNFSISLRSAVFVCSLDRCKSVSVLIESCFKWLSESQCIIIRSQATNHNFMHAMLFRWLAFLQLWTQNSNNKRQTEWILNAVFIAKELQRQKSNEIKRKNITEDENENAWTRNGCWNGWAM